MLRIRQSRTRPLLGAALLAALLAPATAQAIVGGKPSTRAWPALVQVRSDGNFICAGNLVRPDWVLTAAHCIEGGSAKYDVVAGRPRVSGSDGEVIALAQAIVHPGYGSPEPASNDAALLRLARAAPAGSAPIRLIDAGTPLPPGRTVTVAGWGAQMTGGGLSDVLREVDVPLVSDSSCRATVSVTEGFDPATMFCAGELLGGRDSCQGDSGGPAVVPGADGAPVLAGLVSSGFGCAFPTQYGLYTRLAGASLRDWIERTLPAAAQPQPQPQPRPSPAPPGTPAASLSLRITGSAARRRAVLSVRTSAALTAVRATLRAGGRTIATARRTRLRTGTTRITVRLRRRARSVTVAISARDAQGRAVRATRRGRLGR